MKTVLLMGTLDTKGQEIAYMRKIITGMGLGTIVMDVGVIGSPSFPAEITREEVARAGGKELTYLLSGMRRDQIMEIMGKGAAGIASRLYTQGRISGLAAVGGNQGTLIATRAMQAVPLGVPKIMVSTIASGNIRPYIGCTDTAMMFSVADVLGGPNMISRTILANAAGAIVGMCQAHVPMQPSDGKTTIALTAFGNLEPVVSRAVNLLKTSGYEAVTFHSSGAGGSAMEQLVAAGLISGVIDFVPHELLGEILPEDFYAPVRSGRLLPIVAAGIPYVFVPGGLDYYVFGSYPTIPKRLRQRKIHYHNPNNTNVRTSAAELRRVGKMVAEHLSPGASRTRVLIPTRGWTEFSKKGGPLYDPEADAAFVASLRKHASPDLRIEEVDLHVNDPRFAELCVEALLEIIKKG